MFKAIWTINIILRLIFNLHVSTQIHLSRNNLKNLCDCTIAGSEFSLTVSPNLLPKFTSPEAVLPKPDPIPLMQSRSLYGA